MSYSSGGWPLEKTHPGIGGREGAISAKLAIARRVDLLTRVPLFAALTGRQRQAVARASASYRWPAGSRIVIEGSKDQYCFVIVEGTVEVLKGDRRIATLGPGDVFGEIALLDPGPRTATVKTVTDVLAVELSRSNFLEVVGNDPKLLLRMLEALAHRIRETTEALAP